MRRRSTEEDKRVLIMKLKISNAATTIARGRRPTAAQLAADLEYVLATYVDAPIEEVIDGVIKAKKLDAQRASELTACDLLDPLAASSHPAIAMLTGDGLNRATPSVLGSSEFRQDRAAIEHLIAGQEQSTRKAGGARRGARTER